MFGVDTWEPNPAADEDRAAGGRSYKDAGLKEMPLELEQKLAYKGLASRFVPMQMRTADAVLLFGDEALDFVFIDADHRYEGVRQDIGDWLPKIRSGGMISGHDYNPQTFPGVVRAVDELIGNQVRLEQDHVWWATVDGHQPGT
jgi:hypothetical protein